jgi:hypothetical protein
MLLLLVMRVMLLWHPPRLLGLLPMQMLAHQAQPESPAQRLHQRLQLGRGVPRWTWVQGLGPAMARMVTLPANLGPTCRGSHRQTLLPALRRHSLSCLPAPHLWPHQPLLEAGRDLP